MDRVISFEAGEDIKVGQLVIIRNNVAYPIKEKYIEVPRSLKVNRKGRIRIRHRALPPYHIVDPSQEPEVPDGVALFGVEKGRKVPIAV